MIFLVWVEWPEKCFRIDAAALRFLKDAVAARGGRVIRVRSEGEFLKALPQATHVLTWHFKREWYVSAKHLQLIATPAAGRELIAPPPSNMGIDLHFGHFHGGYIAEAVVGFMLAWAKGFFAVRQAPASCRAWPRTWLSNKCFDVNGTRAVIVGYGNIGRTIGEKLQGLGVQVAGITRHGVYQGLTNSSSKVSDNIFRAADWLILALPSTTNTDNYLDAKLIRKLPRRCVVINVGRGNSIDERALYAALSSKRLAGAYLDVRKHEPSATVLEVPGYVPELAKLANCIVMPHAAAFSVNYLLTCLEELIDDKCI